VELIIQLGLPGQFVVIALISLLIGYAGQHLMITHPILGTCVRFLGFFLLLLMIPIFRQQASTEKQAMNIHNIILLFLGAFYGYCGFYLHDKALWCLSLLCIFSVFSNGLIGMLDDTCYFINIETPLNSIMLSLCVLVVYFIVPPQYRLFPSVTFNISLLYFFVSFFIQGIEKRNDMGWILLTFVVCASSIGLGSIMENGAFRGYGLVFLLLELFTQYCIHVWGSVNGIVFFLGLSIISGAIALRAEALAKFITYGYFH